jgi:hypothetical protein
MSTWVMMGIALPDEEARASGFPGEPSVADAAALVMSDILSRIDP